MNNEPELDDTSDDQAAEPAAEKNTVTFKRSHLYAVLLPLAFVLGLSVGYIFWGRGAPAAATAQSAAAAQAAADQSAVNQATGTQEVRRYDIPVDDDPSIGPASAKITIVEFSDYECPYCIKWHNEVWPRLQAAYPDQVRLVYRDFPLTSIHGNAAVAAEAANCAGEQDEYWAYNQLLFGGEYGLGESAYKKYASDLGLEAAAFEECLSSRRFQAEVEADYNFAANLGIRSTPTFFVNGIAIVGAQPFEVFQQVVDLELAGQLSN
jgi:protein-disulfide isomerase